MAKRVPVESSMLQAVGYDPETRILEVVFSSGQTYYYKDVPPEVHQELMAADSKGQYMRAAIIGVYSDYRVSRRRRR
jgi:KTSC domain